MLAMAGWIKYLSEWLRLPKRGNLAELDRQIQKFRLLKESYVNDCAPAWSEHEVENGQRSDVCTP